VGGCRGGGGCVRVGVDMSVGVCDGLVAADTSNCTATMCRYICVCICGGGWGGDVIVGVGVFYVMALWRDAISKCTGTK